MRFRDNYSMVSKVKVFAIVSDYRGLRAGEATPADIGIRGTGSGRGSSDRRCRC